MPESFSCDSGLNSVPDTQWLLMYLPSSTSAYLSHKAKATRMIVPFVVKSCYKAAQKSQIHTPFSYLLVSILLWKVTDTIEKITKLMFSRWVDMHTGRLFVSKDRNISLWQRNQLKAVGS